MSKIREFAKGQECQAKLTGICNHNPETTVFAHYRVAGMCGMGIKPPDLFGAFLCSDCHDETDRRTQKLERDFVDYEFLQAVIRTQNILLKAGLIQI